MPIYEYQCAACGKQVELFLRSVTSRGSGACPQCGSPSLTRVMSRFAVHRGGSEFAGPDEERYIEGLESEDPEAMAHWARRMGSELGDGDPEMQRALAEMGAGEAPDDAFGDEGLDDFE